MTPLRVFTPLLLVRHAQSEWNANGRWQGHADPPLTALGRGQAEALADRQVAALAAEGVRLIECSDLRRARETAAPLAQRLGIPVRVDPRYRELDIGAWSGLRRDEIVARDPELLARFETEAPGVRPPGGETRKELRARARTAIQALGTAHPAERILLVTHLGFIRALLPDAEPANAQLYRTTVRAALARRGPPAGPMAPHAY